MNNRQSPLQQFINFLLRKSNQPRSLEAEMEETLNRVEENIEKKSRALSQKNQSSF